MTQIFDERGFVFPVTVVSAGPIVVTQIKSKDKDGYGAVQFGFGSKKGKNATKAEAGHTKDLGTFAYLREERIVGEGDSLPKVGDKVDASIFAPGDKITVSAISKGKGFQGVVKRHGFKGGRRSHGQKHSEREPGSIGGGLRSRVPKGMRMAGRMGNDRITVKNLTVVGVNPSENILLIKGALPGRAGTLVEIRGI